MVSGYDIKDITLGPIAPRTGHETYANAEYTPPQGGPQSKIIYKKNKFDNPLFSRLEVSFSQLAQLLLAPGLTSPQFLVVNGNKEILGVAVEHLCYAIAKREGLNRSFYTLTTTQSDCSISSKKISVAQDIPIYFLDKLPQGFFARLVQEEEANRLTINYESLSSVLATSYTLEEDDLHKGNFGFYLVEKKGKAQVVFFKIDHDLMFVDSIMGFESRRIFHLPHTRHAFDITTKDLTNFPNLEDSSNSYWPTKFGYIANPFAEKEYHSFEDNRAFSRLAMNPKFIKGKWNAFYKHSLISQELIQETLMKSADFNKASDRAHIALVTHSVMSRLAHLRAALFSIPQFRKHLVSLGESRRILREIIPSNHPLEQSLNDSITHYQNYAKNGFEEGDTPLHTIIKLGEYRYEETIRMFGHFINTKNNAGKTPLDIAFEKFIPSYEPEDICKDMQYVMKHLLSKGAKKPTTFTTTLVAQIEKYTVKNVYCEKITTELSYTDFKGVLRDIGEDHQLCLKHKKNLAIECIEQWIYLKRQDNKFREELLQLRNGINGYSSEENSAGLKYMRQLRTELWFLRQIRGAYGITTTQVRINNLINQELDYLRCKSPSYSFFNQNAERTSLGLEFATRFCI